jgi:hypothetical protein|tara:strand:- start:212 stop:1276 length:1065 start_codon:yes stop_codon:yes gene_type:complete
VLVQVTDETGTGVSDQEVYVVISDGDGVVEDFTGNTALDGFLRIADIKVEAQYTAAAVTLFEDYPYRSLQTPLTPGVEAVLPLNVFTVSSDPSNPHINVLHMVINVLQPGVYQVIQLVEVLNPGETAGFTGESFDGREIGLVIPVPPTAANVAPVEQIGGLDPSRLSLDGNRLLDLRPLPPGVHQMVLQYELLPGTGGADIELTVPYPTAQVTILAGPGIDSVEIRSDQLIEQPPATDIPGGPFAYWTSDVFASGDTLRFRLGPQRPMLSTASWSLLALAVALLASSAASIWGGRSSEHPQQRALFVAQIAQLDRDHDRGLINGSDYHARRGQAIEQLMEIQSGHSVTPNSPDA